MMNSQEKPTKMKIVYVQAIKIERANVKIHINYCYNGHLYALFTCFVFTTPHHSSGHIPRNTHSPCIHTNTNTIALIHSLHWAICLCCCWSFRIHNSFSLQLSPCIHFFLHCTCFYSPRLSLSLTLFKLAIFFGFIFLFFSCYRWQRLSAALSAATLSSTINCWNI